MLTPLWLRSIQRRPQTAVLLLLLSSMMVMTSVLGPLLVRAVHQSALSDALDLAGREGRSIAVSSEVTADEPWQPAREHAMGVLASGRQQGGDSLWTEPEVVINSTTIVVWKVGRQGPETNVVINALDDGCDALVIVAGRCPQGTGQVLISKDDTDQGKIKPGAVLSFALARASDTSLTVSGIYDPVASASAGLVRPGTTEGVLAGAKGDPLVITAAQAANLPLPVKITARMAARPELPIAAVPTTQASVESIRKASNGQDRLIAVKTGLPDILDRVADQARLAQVLVMITAIQALFLGVFALSIVLQRIGRARAAEWSVGRLRGVSRRRWLASVYVEPAVAILAGLPLGFAAGVGVAELGIGLALRPGTPLELWRWPVLAAALATTLIALGALIAVSLRSVRQPLADLVQQQAESRGLSTLGAVAQTMVFLLAAVTLYQLVSGGLLTSSGPQLGLLAPGLFALALAIVAVRTTVLVGGTGTRRPPRRLALLVVGRHAARMPSSLNPAMIITVGVALAVCATQIFVFSMRNQALRADAATGAHTVLQVSVRPGVDLMTAVRAADPGGRQAMAVKETPIEGFSGISRMVAVDSGRLAAVASWQPEWARVNDLAATLKGRAQEPIMFKGAAVQVSLNDVRVQQRSSDLSNRRAPAPPSMMLTVESKGSWQRIDLGAVRGAKGDREQRLAGQIPCAEGCRVVSLGLKSADSAPYKAWFTVTDLAVDDHEVAGVAESLTTTGKWRSQSINDILPATVGATPLASGDGLAVEAFDDQGGAFAAFSPADTVDPLPAVLGPETTAEPVPGGDGLGKGTGLDSAPQQLAIVGRAAILPRTLDEGVLVDLGNAQGLSDPAASRSVDEVWLSADAPAGLEDRLEKQGILVQSRERLSDVRADFQGQATTRGAAAAMIIAAAALLLTLLALVASRWADAARRREDWAALREGGLGPKRLRSLVLMGIAAPAILAVIVGGLSGAVAARVAAPRLPLVDGSAPGPPLDLHLSWWPILGTALGTTLIILLIAQVAAIAETRRGVDR